MIFEVTSSSNWHAHCDIEEQYPLLVKKYNGKRLPCEYKAGKHKKICYSFVVEINSIEELVKMKEDFGYLIIIDQDRYSQSPIKNVIEIYDDYRE